MKGTRGSFRRSFSSTPSPSSRPSIPPPSSSSTMGFVMVIFITSLLCDTCCEDSGTGDSLVGTISRDPPCFISCWKLSCEPASSSLIVLLLEWRNPEFLISSLDIVLLLPRKEFRDPLNEVLEPRALMDAREPWIDVREP